MHVGEQKWGWARPLMEDLERRELMSAAVTKVTPIRHVSSRPAVHAAKHAVKKVIAKKKAASVVAVPTPVAWNDLVGTWTGTFTDNVTRVAKPFSVTFQPRVAKWNTGTYNLSGMVGVSSALTTVTPDANGDVLVFVPLANGGSVCFAGGLALNGKYMVGRWSTEVGTKFATGIFNLTRP